MFWLQIALTFAAAVGVGVRQSRRARGTVVHPKGILAAVGGLILGIGQFFAVLSACLFGNGFGKTSNDPMAAWAWLAITVSAVVLIYGQTYALNQMAAFTRERARQERESESIDSPKRHNS